jgi:hypothetical protein
MSLFGFTEELNQAAIAAGLAPAKPGETVSPEGEEE